MARSNKSQNRKPTRSRLRSVSVDAELRDEIDWDRFAWALLQFCRLKLETGEPEDSVL